MTCSVSVDRTSLSLSPLVVTDTAGDPFTFTDDGIGQVLQTVRSETAPQSRGVNGSEVTSYALDASSLTVAFFIRGTSTADVYAQRDAWNAALFRLNYQITHTVDGVANTYLAGPCVLSPVRSNVDTGVLEQHFETYSVTIPILNPTPL